MDALVVDESTKDMLGRQLKTIAVNSEKVREAIRGLMDLLPSPEQNRDGTLPAWEMDKVTMTLEISAEGGVKLVGSATVAVTGGIEVTFRRPA
jgi:hypothetical protein